MADAEPRRSATLNGWAGHGRARCLHVPPGGGTECGGRPLRHILVERSPGVYVTTIVCHLHVPAGTSVEGFLDSHVWSSWQSSCRDPVSLWVDSNGTGYGRCEPDERDETDAELAELLQHDGGR